jgi:CheY-like chemotaxis protein
MDDDERQQVREVLRAHQSRLRVLELQAAKFGDHAPPQVLTEIAEIRAQVARIKGELAAVVPAVERSTARQLRQHALAAYYAQEWERAEELLIQLLAVKPDDQDAQRQLAEAQRQLELRACYQALRDLREAGNWAAVLVGLDDLNRRQPGHPEGERLRVWAEERKRLARIRDVPANAQGGEEPRLPTQAQPTMPAGKAPERERPLRGQYLVIVESDLKTGSLLAAILKQLGAAIVEVRTGMDHAKHLLVDMPAPDMVLIDQTLSGGTTGIDVALWMQTQTHLRRTLRVLLSGAPPEVMTQWIDRGLFHAMLAKPVKIVELKEQLSDLSRHCDVFGVVADEDERPSADRRPAIVIVDDDLGLLSLLRDTVRDMVEEYDVIAYIHPHQALAYVATHAVALVITDLQMPEMDGLQFIGEIKKVSPNTPVLLQTVYISPNVRQRATELGVDYYMSKPFELEDLEKIVANVTSKMGH